MLLHFSISWSPNNSRGKLTPTSAPPRIKTTVFKVAKKCKFCSGGNVLQVAVNLGCKRGGTLKLLGYLMFEAEIFR